MVPILTEAFKSAWQRLSLAFIMFLTSVIISFAINVTVFGIINKNLSHSNSLELLLLGFDRTVFGDLIHNNINWSGNLTMVLSICTICFLISSVFFNAGYIASLMQRNCGAIHFIKNCKHYFLPFFGYAMIFYFIIFLFGSIIILVFLSFFSNPFEAYRTEKPFFYGIIILLVVFFCFISYVWLCSVTSRALYVQGESFFHAIKLALRKIKVNFRKNTIYLIMHWVILILFFLILAEMHVDHSARSTCRLIFSVLAIQTIIFMRTFLKCFDYATILKINI